MQPCIRHLTRDVEVRPEPYAVLSACLLARIEMGAVRRRVLASCRCDVRASTAHVQPQSRPRGRDLQRNPFNDLVLH